MSTNIVDKYSRKMIENLRIRLELAKRIVTLKPDVENDKREPVSRDNELKRTGDAKHKVNRQQWGEILGTLLCMCTPFHQRNDP